jgi:hypothetical protein
MSLLARQLRHGEIPMRVMAIEDDPDTRHFYERFRREEGALRAAAERRGGDRSG